MKFFTCRVHVSMISLTVWDGSRLFVWWLMSVRACHKSSCGWSEIFGLVSILPERPDLFTLVYFLVYCRKINHIRYSDFINEWMIHFVIKFKTFLCFCCWPVLRFRICASWDSLWCRRWRSRGRGSLPSCEWRRHPCRRRCCRRSRWSHPGDWPEQRSDETIATNLMWKNMHVP